MQIQILGIERSEIEIVAALSKTLGEQEDVLFSSGSARAGDDLQNVHRAIGDFGL